MSRSCRRRLPWLLTFVGVVPLAVAQVWRFVSPETLEPRLSEHSEIEMATALAAVAASLVAARRSLGVLRDRGVAAGWALLSGFSFWVAGEEVTWGQDLIGFGAVDVLGVSVDSAHDAPDVAARALVITLGMEDPVLVGLIAVVLIALLVGAAVLLAPRFPRLTSTLARAAASAPGRYVAIAIGSGLAAVVIDNRVIRLVGSQLTERSFEEPLELLSSCALLCAALSGERSAAGGVQGRPS